MKFDVAWVADSAVKTAAAWHLYRMCMATQGVLLHIKAAVYERLYKAAAKLILP